MLFFGAFLYVELPGVSDKMAKQIQTIGNGCVNFSGLKLEKL